MATVKKSARKRVTTKSKGARRKTTKTVARSRSKSSSSKTYQIKVNISFDANKVQLTPHGPYTGVSLQTGIPRGEVGDPALPWHASYVSVPPNCKVQEIKVKPGKLKRLGKGILIEPIQPNLPTIIGEKIQWLDAERSHYEAQSQWPAEIVHPAKLRRSGNFTLAEIELCPFVYDSATRTLSLAQKIVVTVYYKQVGKIPTPAMTPFRARLDNKFARRIESKVLNPESVQEFMSKPDIGVFYEPITLPTYDYVIVTSQTLAPEFERLAHWRTIMGLHARIVTTEDIVANTVPNTGSAVFNHNSGYNDGGTRDLAEAIRNFLKWAVEHWLIDYALLGGDTEIIPCRYALHTHAGTTSYKTLDETYNNELLYSLNASSQLTGSTAANADDDDATTVWECEATDTDPWIAGHLGLNRPINRVDLSWGANHATAYVIETSDNGTSWNQIYSQSSGTGGNESISLTPMSASRLRLRITSGTNFSLSRISVFGPHHNKYGGNAYAFGATTSRIYLTVSLIANPSIDDPQVIIKEGPNAGTIIPYNQSCSATTLGWRFIERLTDSSPTVSNTPTYYIEIKGPAGFHGNRFAIKTNINTIPTDLYYSDMLTAEYPASNEHDWDANGNQIYGERYGGEIDEVNSIPDLFIGRASIETVDEAAIFIDKIIAYERYQTVDEFGITALKPFDVATSVLLGSEDWSPTNTAGVLDGSAYGKEIIRASLNNLDPNRFRFTRRYEDHADIPAADQGSDVDEFSKANIIAGIEENNHVVSLSSHGSSNYLCGLVRSDVDALNNYPGLIYGNACSTYKFDVIPGEALGERAILNSDGAGVAYVGNSRFGWQSDNPMERAFWDTWANCDYLGEAFNASKSPIYGGWQAYSLNLVGDPGMRVWNNTPLQIEVTHPAEACAGMQDFQVLVKHDGQPVAGATVCLSISGSFFKVDTTDSNGLASMSLSSSLTGSLRVTVSGRNLLPYIGTAEVVSCGSGCNLMISCGNLISCGSLISCGLNIACANQISCGQLINCGFAIGGGCRQLLGCGKAIEMCPTIRPPEWGLVDYFKDHWALNDLSELAQRMDEPEVQSVLEQTPEEMRKPLIAMLERIRNEK